MQATTPPSTPTDEAALDAAPPDAATPDQASPSSGPTAPIAPTAAPDVEVARPPARPRRPSTVRALLGRAAAALGSIRSVHEGEERVHDAVRAAYHTFRGSELQRQLDRLPVEKLAEAGGRRVRLPVAALRKAGFDTVAAVLAATPEELERAPGVSDRAAKHSRAAAQHLAEELENGLRVSADLDPADPAAADLLSALYRAKNADKSLAKLREPARTLGERLGVLVEAAAPVRTLLRGALAGRTARQNAFSAVGLLETELDDPANARRLERLDEAGRKLAGPPPAAGRVRRDFEQHSVDYFSTLARIVGARDDANAARGFLPEDLAGRIGAQPLDRTKLKISLRAYQEFGARFALAQRRVILGDEMGCGKTVEAIAVLAHLSTEGERHFLVVCPASVLINWMREVSSHSSLRAHQIHGAQRDEGVRAWLSRGGVAVTTFEALRAIELPRAMRLGAMVVDEAHYVKNTGTQRSQAVRAFADRAERVMFLTGTPMENRVDEFRSLIGYLQPELVPSIDDADGAAGSKAFRKAVAPAYLRRNQEDVLAELPEMVQVDEWEEFSAEDLAAYREAVAARNFMAMRRAAYASGDPNRSAKLRRLLELTEEARENGRKVVVFSNFRDVLDTVGKVLAEAGDAAVVFGPLTGSVPPAQRQEMVDAFAAVKGHAVLTSQIQAGGVGLNMQAASVIILCEPQVKPTLETQAVARAHRMGQIRRVQVHRLLVADSVDQRMLELLSQKAELFNAYARRSELAETTPGAREGGAAELSGRTLERSIIETERARLGLQVQAA